MRLVTVVLISFWAVITQAAPNAIYHLDELGSNSTTYTLDETIANKDGEAL